MTSPMTHGSQFAAEQASWRVKQLVLCAIVVAVGLYFNVIGWKTSPGPSGLASAIPAPPWKWGLLNFVAVEAGFLVLIAFILMLTPAALTIAKATFQETVRRKVLVVILMFALVAIGAVTIFSWMSTGEEEKFIRDFGLGAILFFGMLLSIVLGAWMIPLEIERKTIFTLLSKPVNRVQLLLGKFVGAALTLAVNVLAMWVVFTIAYWLKRHNVEEGRIWGSIFHNTSAIFLTFCALCLLASVAITVSIIASQIVSVVVTFFVYFAGILGGQLYHAGEELQHLQSGSRLTDMLGQVLKVVYYLLPRLDNFDISSKLVLEDPIGFNYIWVTLAWGLLYTGGVLVIAWMFLDSREF
jgi:ABC-type transport system involved in multi-copper enzyme maturation permease subunit